MKKRLFSIIIVLCILASTAVLPARAAAGSTGLTALHIPDKSRSYTAFSRAAGLVQDLDDSTNRQQVFDYSVPKNGLTVLIFFREKSCINSDRLIDEIAATQWAKNDLVNIVAVEVTDSDKSAVRSYMTRHDPDGVIDKTYYNGSSMGFWYAKLVSQNGNMSGVTNWGDAVFSAAYVLLITEEAGTKYIEFSLPGVDTAAYLTRYINEIIETSDPSFTDQIVEVTVPGAERYDYAKEVFDKINAERKAANAGTVAFSDKLTKLAMQRAAELAVYFDHTRPNREGPFSVNGETVKGVAVTYNGLISENIAMGQTDPAAVMSAWMSSTMGHRENILNKGHTQVGVGCFENDGTLYWVQLFGTGSDGASPSATGRVPADVVVETSVARLDLSLSSVSGITMDNGQTITAPTLINTNKGYDSFKAILRPVVSEIKGASGAAVATVSYGDAGSGTVQLTASSIGTANVVFAAYKGQTDAPSVKLTVNGSTGPTQPGASWKNPFTDVSEKDWFYNEAAYVVQNGLIKGTTETTFEPNTTTTRAMIVTILYRLEKSPAAGKVSFNDVKAGAWYYEAVAWASANGIVSGYGNGNFGPDDPVTREQAATILYRYAGYKGYDRGGLADLTGFADAGTVSDWALTAVRWANGKGLINGRTTTTLVPGGTANRAEIAAIITRFCRNVAGLE